MRQHKIKAVEILLWLLIPAGFVAFWCFVCLVISLASGWHKLARHFRATQNSAQIIEGQTFYLQRAQLNGAQYKGCLTFKTTDQGLFISVLSLFRAGHPPLMIPWSAFSDFQAQKIWWATLYVTTISVPQGSKVSLTVTNKNLLDALQLYRMNYL